MLALDTVSATVPVDLATLANIPTSGATSGNYAAANGYWQNNGTKTVTGCLKVEYVNAAGTATDVTAEILDWATWAEHKSAGYTYRSSNSARFAGRWHAAWRFLETPCPDISPNAVIRIERFAITLRMDSRQPLRNGANGNDYWPNVLYDTREGVPNPNFNPGQIVALGNMYYIELDANNLARWLQGTIGVSGPLANNVGGYEVYFSDRRGNVADPSLGPRWDHSGTTTSLTPRAETPARMGYWIRVKTSKETGSFGNMAGQLCYSRIRKRASPSQEWEIFWQTDFAQAPLPSGNSTRQHKKHVKIPTSFSGVR